MNDLPRASALHWFPRIEAAGLPVPKTIMVPFEYRGVVSIFDGMVSPEFERVCSEVSKAADAISDGRVFIRTDISSAKHFGLEAISIVERGWSPVAKCLSLVFEHHELSFMFGPDPQAIMVREFLDLPAPFTAFHGLPISLEFRFFADAGNVFCVHPYWPECALEHHIDPDQSEGWKTYLAFQQKRPPLDELQELTAMARKAAAACDSTGQHDQGRWSVDFAQDRRGKWWLLDMAPMEESWHWPDCPNNPERER